MGRVFSPEQIQNSEVPEIGAHQEAAREILNKLFDDVEAENAGRRLHLFDPNGSGVKSAMVYGSTAYGTSNRRSDLDVLIFYDPSQSVTALRRIAGVLNEASDRYSVPLEPNILPEGAVNDDREHGMEPLFVQHLIEMSQRANGIWVRHNPANGLQRIADQADKPEIVSALAHSYVSNRRNYFAKALVEVGDPINYNALQRALELPSAIGRKAVAATMHEDEEPLDLSSRLSMEARAEDALLRFLTDSAADKEIASAHKRLYAMDRQYTKILERTMSGEIELDDYESWVKARAANAMEWALMLSQKWTEILRTNHKVVKRRAQLVAATKPKADSGVFFGELSTSPGDASLDAAQDKIAAELVTAPAIVDDFPGGGSYT